MHKLNERTAYYYSYDVESNGNKYLVSKAVGKHEKDFGLMNDDEVDFQLCISKLVVSLTDKQQRGFASVLSRLTSLYIHKKNNSTYVPICNIPTSKADLDRIYTRSGTSISKNLPTPDCRKLKEHSYVSIKDCVADFLMNNTESIVDIDDWHTELKDADRYTYSRLVFDNRHSHYLIKKLSERKEKYKVNLPYPILPIFLFFWSEDFDPNRSIKSNRQSVWIKTCTIKCMSYDGEVIENTYPISVSKKECDHEEVQKEVQEEIKELSSGKFILIYSRSHNCPVYVHADVFCYKMDQPERRSNLKLLAGNSNLHGRYGFLQDIKNKVGVIRSCIKCRESIMNEIENDKIDENGWRSNKCSVCTNWMYDYESELLDYDIECDTEGLEGEMRNGKMKCRKISLDKMQSALEYAKNRLVHHGWNSTKCTDFLNQHGFHTAVIKELLKKLCKLKAFGEAEIGKDSNPELWGEMLEALKGNPEDFDPMKRPSIWYESEDLDLYPDIPMHLLFLGIVKTVIKEIVTWLKSRYHHTIFCDMVRGILDEIKQLNLSWCKVLAFSEDNFGGWVSENYLGLCRISEWFYTMLEYLPEKELYSDPITDYSKWNMKQNQAWLRARGLKTKGKKAKELQEIVKGYYDSNDIPEIIINKVCDTNAVLKMIHAMNRMITCCMRANNDDKQVEYLHAIIRYFLILYDDFNSSLTTSKNPGWVTAYNFLSLLNIPDTVYRYGSMRVLWEGGDDGEGFLRSVKNELKCGLLRQWQVWLMNNLLEEKTFDKLLPNEDINSSRSQLCEFKIYACRNKIFEQYKKCKPISGFIMDENHNKVYIAYREKRKIVGIKIAMKQSNRIKRNNLEYSKIIFTNKTIEITDKMDDVRMGVLLLPMFPLEYETEYPREAFDYKSVIYTMIGSDWSYMR